MILKRDENSKMRGKKTKFHWREIETGGQRVKEKLHENVLPQGEMKRVGKCHVH